jgi:peptidoglycan hydrolase CwlO-like protein
MFNPDYDPFDALQQLQVAIMSHEQGMDELSEHQKQQAQLLEMMANQVKHLTNAVVGLQQQNKILHTRVTRLEDVHG